MDILGIDISKAKFDVALLIGERVRHATFSNIEAGFQQLLAWLAKHRPDPAAPLHACMEATGNWGLELADFLHGQKLRVSVVNPARVKAYGQSELARNKTDRLDAALIARFCRAHAPSTWVPPLPHLRELRELVRRCDALKAARVQELNRQKSGSASPAVDDCRGSCLQHLDRRKYPPARSARCLPVRRSGLNDHRIAGVQVTGRNNTVGSRQAATVGNEGAVRDAPCRMDRSDQANAETMHEQPKPATA